MPIYEYRCEACGHELDALQKLADDPLKDCPECVSPSLRRLVSAPAFRLKGSGWYETDFKSEKETKRNLAEHPAEGKAPKEDKAEKKAGGEQAAEGATTNKESKQAGSKAEKPAAPSSGSSGTKGSGTAAA